MNIPKVAELQDRVSALSPADFAYAMARLWGMTSVLLTDEQLNILDGVVSQLEQGI